MSTPDDKIGIEPYWTHTAAGMHMGAMEPRPLAGEFGAVLTLAAKSGTVDTAIRHRHLPMSFVQFDVDLTVAAINWTMDQVESGRTILIRSEIGRQRPGLVIAGACVRLGATPSEALWCVRHNKRDALTDFRYVKFVSQLFEALRQ